MSNKRLPILINGIRKVDFILTEENQVIGLEILPEYRNDFTPKQIGDIQTVLFPQYHLTVVDPTQRIVYELKF